MYTPAEVAKNVIGIGKGKAALPVSRMFVLGIMAGIFIGLAAVASNTISCTVESGSIAKLLSGIVFPEMCIRDSSDAGRGAEASGYQRRF